MKTPRAIITAITFDDTSRITHVEMMDGADVNDVLQIVKQWNARKWEHPNSQVASNIAGDDTGLQSVSVQ